MDRSKESYLVKCSSCGASNRLTGEMASKVGKCGECHSTLPVLYIEPIALGEKSFREFLRGYSGPVLAEFWAPW